jgi:aminobenzoyl-glutamate transport protein
MLPYTIAFAIIWTLLLSAWILLGLPVGPGAHIHWAVPAL